MSSTSYLTVNRVGLVPHILIREKKNPKVTQASKSFNSKKAHDSRAGCVRFCCLGFLFSSFFLSFLCKYGGSGERLCV